MISEKPRSETRSDTWLGTMMTGAVPRLRSVSWTIARSEGRWRWSKWACVTSTTSIGGRSRTCSPGRLQPLQHKQPAREIGIDHHVAPADLHEKTGVTDEGDPQFAVRGQPRLASLAGAPGDRRMPHQAAELPRTLPQSRVMKGCLDHPAATGPETTLPRPMLRFSARLVEYQGRCRLLHR